MPQPTIRIDADREAPLWAAVQILDMCNFENLHNVGIKNVICCGIFTDQCVSSTVRSLADESFNVIVLEDCCAAGSDELHHKELEIINMIYCHVMSSGELLDMMKLA